MARLYFPAETQCYVVFLLADGDDVLGVAQDGGEPIWWEGGGLVGFAGGD